MCGGQKSKEKYLHPEKNGYAKDISNILSLLDKIEKKGLKYYL